MKRFSLLALSCILLIIGQSLFAFSNMIIFGDSLSDNGNFPESPTPYITSNAPHIVQNTNTPFYVPFSNPVDTSNGSGAPPLATIERRLPWPQLDPTLLAEQVPITWQNQHQAQRAYRSLSWTELMLGYANALSLSSSEAVVPSMLVHDHEIPKNASVNYAWGYALAGTGCYDTHYNPWPSCQREQVWQKRQQYMHAPTDTNRLQLMIPSTSSQVDFFLQDLQANKVHVDTNTVYVFWIGGNNMIKSYNHLLDWHPIDMLHFIFAVPNAVVLQAITHITDTLPSDKLPKTMYIFNLMDPSLTPGYYHTKIAPLATALSSLYNFWTSMRIDYYNMTHKTKVKIIPVHSWYNEASRHHYFKQHLGESCQVKGGNFTQADSIPNNCQGFMYWNDVHPTVNMHKITAYRFLKHLN